MAGIENRKNAATAVWKKTPIDLVIRGMHAKNSCGSSSRLAKRLIDDFEHQINSQLEVAQKYYATMGQVIASLDRR